MVLFFVFFCILCMEFSHVKKKQIVKLNES